MWTNHWSLHQLRLESLQSPLPLKGGAFGRCIITVSQCLRHAHRVSFFMLNDQLDYMFLSEEKLQLSLGVLADKYNEKIRKFIIYMYNDPHIASIYGAKRESGMFESGSKSKVHREIIQFPHPIIYDFLNKVMGSMYGPDWLFNNKALKHELVRPWWVVKKL